MSEESVTPILCSQFRRKRAHFQECGWGECDIGAAVVSCLSEKDRVNGLTSFQGRDSSRPLFKGHPVSPGSLQHTAELIILARGFDLICLSEK